jgi:hypothetical protein
MPLKSANPSNTCNGNLVKTAKGWCQSSRPSTARWRSRHSLKLLPSPHHLISILAAPSHRPQDRSLQRQVYVDDLAANLDSLPFEPPHPSPHAACRTMVNGPAALWNAALPGFTLPAAVKCCSWLPCRSHCCATSHHAHYPVRALSRRSCATARPAAC